MEGAPFLAEVARSGDFDDFEGGLPHFLRVVRARVGPLTFRN